PAMQVKLLRVLQERSFEPVGTTETRTVDARVVLATNVDLAQLVVDQKFRQDLYFRINVVSIRMPSLRERLVDIPLLSGHFLRHFCRESSREILGFSDSAMNAMQRYDWPGNVRELENAIERAVVLCRRPQIDLDDLPDSIRQYSAPSVVLTSLDDLFNTPMPLEVAMEAPEKRIIQAALARNNYNRQATAAELDINRTTLYKKMRKYRLDVGE
ncbi:MAG: sigma 54-interacting transcriptional regulator, partial [Tepidisphaeraceae bacterium]